MFKVHRTPSRLAVALFAATALVATGCGSDDAADESTTTAASGDSITTLKVEVDDTFWQEAFNYANDEGWFEEAGIEIEPVEFGPDSAVPLVLNGQADIGVTAMGNVIVAVDNGMDLKAIAGMFIEGEGRESIMSSIIAGPNSGITEIGDLAGKKVAVNELRSASVAKAMWRVDEAGADASTMEWVAVPFPGMVEALTRGDVDAAVIVEPFTNMAEAAGATWISPLADLNDPVPVFFAKGDWATKNPEVAEKFIEVLERAYEHGNANRDEMKASFAERSGTPIEAANAQPDLVWQARLVKEIVEKNVATMHKYGFIEKKLGIGDVAEESLAR